MRTRTTLIVIVLLLALLTLAACGGGARESTSQQPQEPVPDAQIVGDPVAGEAVYQSTCVACHGPDARGLPNLGKSMHPGDSEFIRNSTDQELVEFVKVGRTPDDPANTTGVGMPAKGGNPAITEQQLYDVVAWMRTLD